MKKSSRVFLTVFAAGFSLLFWASPGHPYAGGPTGFVTDAGPFCTACHSIVEARYIPEKPLIRGFKSAEDEVFENKHYKAIKEGAGNYKPMSPEDRQKLLDQVQAMDANSSVSISAPTSVKPGEKIQVTVKVKGGSGPVVGVMLVDAPFRYQSRPISANGWWIVDAPKVIGPDGKEQTTWTDMRYAGLPKNVNFVLVFGVDADVASKKFSEAQVTYTVRAPADRGEYDLVAAFIHGTEINETKTAEFKLPPGGGAAPSGRLRFSDIVRVKVQ
ncbi:MAG: hypothetical protein HY731_10800 [Candidatus Tectomicrobia bacterium]|nr:hypothetical protein [Candidatus Tectomicrobia bacterium]